MVNRVSIATSTQPAAQPKPVETNAKAAESKPRQAPSETVQISKAAQAAQAALKEMTEARFQTVQEANKGDIQAKMLLAREDAEKAAMQGGNTQSGSNIIANMQGGIKL